MPWSGNRGCGDGMEWSGVEWCFIFAGIGRIMGVSGRRGEGQRCWNF